MSGVSPLCNSMHYMLSLPSVCVQHLKRRFLFPKSPFVFCGPQVSGNTSRNRPATTVSPTACMCVLQLSISIFRAKHPFLKTDIFHMGVSLQLRTRGLLSHKVKFYMTFSVFTIQSKSHFEGQSHNLMCNEIKKNPQYDKTYSVFFVISPVQVSQNRVLQFNLLLLVCASSLCVNESTSLAEENCDTRG